MDSNSLSKLTERAKLSRLAKILHAIGSRRQRLAGRGTQGRKDRRRHGRAAKHENYSAALLFHDAHWCE